MNKKIIKFVLTVLSLSSILISCKGITWGGKVEDITDNLFVTYTFYADSSKTESTQRKYLVGEKYEFPSADKELLKELGKAGYEPAGWIFIPSEEEPETPATLVVEDGYVKEFTATFIDRSFYADGWAAIPSNYTIKYMVENAENDEYTLHSEEVVVSYEHCVIRKEDIDPYIKEIEHFTYDSLRLVVPEEIEPDNKTVVNLYYKRNLETVIVDLDGGTTTTELNALTDGTYEYTGKYESSIKINTPVKDKFEFQYWEDSDQNQISATLLYVGSVDFIKAHYEPIKRTVNGIEITFVQAGGNIDTKTITRESSESSYTFSMNLPASVAGYDYVWTINGIDSATDEKYTIDTADMKSGFYEVLCIATEKDTGKVHVGVQQFQVNNTLDLSK